MHSALPRSKRESYSRSAVMRGAARVPHQRPDPRPPQGICGMAHLATRPAERLEFIWLELTGRCNLECVHCYADSGPSRPLEEGVTLEDWLQVLDDAAALGCRRVQFIGGEPTIYPGLPQLIAHARGAGFTEICVYTNGTHVTEALKRVFLDNRVSLAFSVYGSSGATHDEVTRRKGSFLKTDRAVRWAVDAGLGVRAGIIEMESNAHDVGPAERALREAGVTAIHVDRLRGLGRGADERPAASQMGELCGRCGAGKVCVSSSGEIYPCVFARFAPLGRVADGGLAQALSGWRLRDFQDELAESQRAGRRARLMADDCTPEQPAPDCGPERPSPPCSPEIPSHCGPEEPAPDCGPERPAPPCSPEVAVSATVSPA
ncbi:MAG: radical SAM protein [Phenylobacterium sp.]|nr:MAG: radical SAM protein [Phenylobacterium sp.]